MRQLPLTTNDSSSPWWSCAGTRAPGSKDMRMVAVPRLSSTESVFTFTPGNGRTGQRPSPARMVRLSWGTPLTASRMRRRSSGGGAMGSMDSATMVSSTSTSSRVKTSVMSLPLRNLHAQCRHFLADHTTQFCFSESVASGQFAKSGPAEEDLPDQACRSRSLGIYGARGRLDWSPGQSRIPRQPDQDTKLILAGFIGRFPQADERLLQRRARGLGVAGDAQSQRVQTRSVCVVQRLKLLGTHRFTGEFISPEC